MSETSKIKEYIISNGYSRRNGFLFLQKGDVVQIHSFLVRFDENLKSPATYLIAEIHSMAEAITFVQENGSLI